MWPDAGRWACLGPAAGRSGCDLGGDAIQYLRERDGLSYQEACGQLGITPHLDVNGRGMRSAKNWTAGVLACSPAGHHAPTVAIPLTPPNPAWQGRAAAWSARCATLLWCEEGSKARAYLHGRGLYDGVLRACNVGYNPTDAYEDHAHWGLPQPEAGHHRIWLPRGITFPWTIGGALWRLNIRRPLTPAQIAAGEAKYIGPAGFANGLYNADALAGRLAYDRPVVLVEGELDALTVAQACGTGIAAVATGSTAGARRNEWIARLAQASVVLLAFDVDVDDNGAGDKAAAWWQQRLPRARPTHQPNLPTKKEHPMANTAPPPTYTGRYALKNQLSAGQAAQFEAIIATYAPDLHDPAAVEVLLVLREVCTILDFPLAELEQLFGARLLGALATWGDIVVSPKSRPAQVDRAWVWRVDRANPRPYRIDRKGFIYIGEENGHHK